MLYQKDQCAFLVNSAYVLLCANRIAYIFNIFNIYLFIHIHHHIGCPLVLFFYNTQWWITISVIQHYRWLTCLRLACSVCLLVNRLSLLSLTTSSAFALPAQDFVDKTVENHRWIETVSSARNKTWRRLPDTCPKQHTGLANIAQWNPLFLVKVALLLAEFNDLYTFFCLLLFLDSSFLIAILNFTLLLCFNLLLYFCTSVICMYINSKLIN